jgi:type I restriction enzyme S subunit
MSPSHPDPIIAWVVGSFKAATEPTFQADANFALEALPALTTRPDQIRQLRQTILNLAVSGKLSEQSAWQAKPIKLSEVASL